MSSEARPPAGHRARSLEDEGPDFGLTTQQLDLKARMKAFIADVVGPRERELFAPGGVTDESIQNLRNKAKAAGVYGPHLPREYGGLECDWRTIAIAFEEAGTSLLGPLSINGAAPDEGNMHLLSQVADDTQRTRYLEPLAQGRARSAFAMTEPMPGVGSDPAMLLTTAERRGSQWVLNGRKWYTTGALGASFAIVMARTSSQADPRRGASMFIVDTDNPGMTVLRVTKTLDRHTFLGGHAEVEFRDCMVPHSSILGKEDLGFEYAQVRLVPARLTHCMRWLGIARRALDIAIAYSTERTSSGVRLSEHELVQAMLADSAIELHASRLMIWHAAWRLDSGKAAREESSMAKVFVAESVNRIIDRCLQVAGGYGNSDDSLLSVFYREARPFRVYDGPSEVHREAIARRLTRRRELDAGNARG